MSSQILEELFGTFDFSVLGSSDFKEDSVREEVILPILHSLGYSPTGLNRIVRSRTLLHPFVNIGSQKRKIYLIPDYLLAVENKPAWILDAKSPTENIAVGENVEQAYSYAIHPDIRVKYFALCNGREFIIFNVNAAKPVLYFQVSEISPYWQQLYNMLAPQAFIAPAALVGKPETTVQETYDYAKTRPPTEIKDLKKQSARRHFGVHPYFTKQVWNVVQEYIKTFSRPGDIVLDPYGGSGVTLVEALILGRKAIHVDINPLANFIVQNLISPVDINELTTHYNRINKQFKKNAPRTKNEIEKALSKYDYPKGIKLPRTSDVTTVEKLFSPLQLAQLAYLKHLIKQVRSDNIRGTLLLMFSGLLNKINLTYHASSVRAVGGGDSSAFRYYRYRLAPNPAKLDLMQYLESRLNKVIAAKKEIAPFINTSDIMDATVRKGSATNLDFIDDQSLLQNSLKPVGDW